MDSSVPGEEGRAREPLRARRRQAQKGEQLRDFAVETVGAAQPLVPIE
jgi:hypothetical protein